MISPHHLYAVDASFAAVEKDDDSGWSRDADSPDGLAVIRVHGVLRKPLLVELKKEFNRLKGDASVSEVVVVIDSPGGTVAGTHNAYEALASLRQAKPVTVAVDDLCASAAYWIASAASSIYVNASAGVGSIGAYVAIADTSQLLNSIGVRVLVIRSGKHKGAGLAGTKLSEEQRDEIQRGINATTWLFVKSIANARPLVSRSLEQVADGRLLTAQEAVELGLADGVASVDDVIARVAGQLTPSYAHLTGDAALDKYAELLARANPAVTPETAQHSETWPIKCHHRELFEAAEAELSKRREVAEREERERYEAKRERLWQRSR